MRVRVVAGAGSVCFWLGERVLSWWVAGAGVACALLGDWGPELISPQ